MREMNEHTLYLNAELYCVLCRYDLPRSLFEHRIGWPLKSNNHEDWELNVIGFFDAARDESCSGVPTAPSAGLHVFRANLKESTWPPDYSSPFRILRRKGHAQSTSVCVGFSKRPCQDRQHFDPYGILFFVHECCWKAVRRRADWQQHPSAALLTFRHLYWLGRNTRSLLPRACVSGDEYAAALSQLPSLLAADASHPSGLGALLSQAASKLPAELHLHIARHLQGGLVSSLLRSRETVSMLLRLLLTAEPSFTPWQGVRKEQLFRTNPDMATGSRDGHRGQLCANGIRLFGRMYLRTVAFASWAKNRKRKHGYRGSGDGTNGADDGGGWKEPRRPHWDMVIPGLKLLRIRSDGSDDDDPSVGQESWPARALWNTDTELPVRGDLVVADTERLPGHLLHYPGRRLCQFLPLQLHGVAATGLTVYCKYSGICGMTAHFGGDGVSDSQQQRHIGWRRGMPIHMALVADERIVFLSLRVSETLDGRSNFGPSLIVGTNLHQTVLFGVYLSSFSHISTSVLLTKGSQPVYGLFTDILTTDDCCLKSIGMCVDPVSTQRVGSPPSAASVPEWLLLHAPNFRSEAIQPDKGFFSTAHLTSDVWRLQLRKQGDRCVGLSIHHRDGRVEILGRWEPAGDIAGATLSDLYIASDHGRASPDPTVPALSALTFRMALIGEQSWPVRYAYVADIVLGVDPVGPDDVVFTITGNKNP
ncbi:hypothetical protein SPI_07721 [Niveomyces insectorum RCEF 264]|uniref:Uncharacterized protein n=1 Tax=Niveomyces insectorum RCEF 264 TaxID=1081102 RepID=A0A167PJ74_9HYPO|nr:hypothetical protein SPI_07721 [Niveomyces insectorum RCEF 264]